MLRGFAPELASIGQGMERAANRRDLPAQEFSEFLNLDGPNGIVILLLFSNETQFVDDPFGYLVFHIAPFCLLHGLAR